MLNVVAVVALNVPDQQSVATFNDRHLAATCLGATHRSKRGHSGSIEMGTNCQACESSSLGPSRLEKHGRMHVAQCLTEDNRADLQTKFGSKAVSHKLLPESGVGDLK